MLCVASPYSDLAAERHQLSTSLQESHKLASQVDRLGTQLDQVNEEKQKVWPHKHSLLKFFFNPNHSKKCLHFNYREGHL